MTCGDSRSCATCQATRDCAECTATARCGACRGVLFKARRSSPSIDSSASSTQGKRPRRLLLDPAAEQDRLELPRDKSGLDVYYQKVASVTSAVHKGGARWFIDVGARVKERCPAVAPFTGGGHAACLAACLPARLEACAGLPKDWPISVRDRARADARDPHLSARRALRPSFSTNGSSPRTATRRPRTSGSTTFGESSCRSTRMPRPSTRWRQRTSRPRTRRTRWSSARRSPACAPLHPPRPRTGAPTARVVQTTWRWAVAQPCLRLQVHGHRAVPRSLCAGSA